MDRLLPTDLPPAADLRVVTRPDGTPAVQPPDGDGPTPDGPTGLHEARPRFTGTGAEYARLWYLHALLTLLTLGVYSAWAKVRRQRWFAQNTELLGSRFDFDANPWRILAGRIVAVVLLVAYTHAFDVTPTVGLAVFAGLAVVAPLLLRSAHRFRLHHTRWRGVRFGFDGGVGEAWRVAGPPAALWLGAGAWAVVEPRTGLWAAGAALLALPWMHARLARWRQGRTRFGDRSFDARPMTAAVYRAHAGSIGWWLLVVAAMVIVGFVGNLIVGIDRRGSGGGAALWVTVIAPLAVVGVAWILVMPYLAVRLQRVVWHRTRLGPVRFRGELDADVLRALILRHYGLTLLTLGLWWPFAAVALARYRIESLVLVADAPLDLAARAVTAPARTSAAGDGAADAFGLDLGW